MISTRWVAVQVEVPDGASHFTGNLLDEADFYKCKDVAGFPQWFWWAGARGEWMLQGDGPPYWAQPIPFLEERHEPDRQDR